MPLQIIRQDITKMSCDAIVNPSNEQLTPGGGVDAAIHEAAGEGLMTACREIGEIMTGEAAVTPAFELPCRYVIHTAGPVWRGGAHGEDELLEACYNNSLLLARQMGCESVAFPLISSGLYGYPKDKVLNIAITTIGGFLFENEMTVYLTVFDKESYELGERLFGDIELYIDDTYAAEHSDGAQSIRSLLQRMCNSESESIDYYDEYDDECCKSKKAGRSIDNYIKLDESFALKLLWLIDAKKMSDVECYKKANVSKQTWYKIINDKDYRPNKKTVISFAVALSLSLEQTQELLSSVGFVLSRSSLFDVIIMYCLENGIYDVLEIDAVLFKYDQETLYSKL